MIKVFVIVLSLFSVSVGAEGAKLKHGFLNFEPYWKVNEDKTYSGIHYDAAKLIYERAGLDVEFSLYPYARLLQGLQKGGTAFITYGENPGLKTEDVVETCVPGVEVVLASYSVDKEIPDTMEGYEGASVISIRGWPLGPYEPMRENKNIKLKMLNNLKAALNMLKLGRADYLITTVLPLQVEAEKLGFDYSTLTSKVVFSTKGYFTSMPNSYQGDREPCKKVRAAADALIAEGKLDEKTLRVLK